MELNKEAMNTIFYEARTHKYFEKTETSDELLIQIYDALKTAPTWANCQPGRFVFVKSPEAKKRLIPHVAESNVRKVEEASVTVIIAGDPAFYKYIPRLYPHGDMASYYEKNPDIAERTMFQSTCLQGAYLIIAARALGLDCGPLGGFDNAGVDEEFFPDGRWKSNFLCNLGIGDKSKLHPREDRFEFDEACLIL